MGNSKVSILNRKARHNYEVLDTYVCGMQLFGSEVKAIRAGQVSMQDSFCVVDDGELFTRGVSIQNLPHMTPHEPERSKKLLLKRKELDDLADSLDRGLTVVPLRIFETKKGYLKLEVALAKGRKLYDKRKKLKDKQDKREINEAT